MWSSGRRLVADLKASALLSHHSPDRSGHLSTPAGLDHEFSELLGAIAQPNRGRVVVVRGAPGLGKSTLVDRLMERARRTGMRVLQADGLPQEAALPFWTLHQLIYPLVRDPFVQDQGGTELMDALLVEMGSRHPDVGARLRVSRSALGFLAEVASRTPLLLVVDDAEWMDEYTRDLLSFVLNRLPGGDVALVLVYNRSVPHELRNSRLIEIAVGPMSPDDARHVLLVEHPQLPPYVVDRIVAEADGNRLAVSAYPAMLSHDQLDGHALLPLVLPLPPALLDHYRDTLAALPPSARRELVLAAVNDVATAATATKVAPDLDNAWTPDADSLDLFRSLDLLSPADAGRVRLANRTVRNAIYSLAPPAELHSAHEHLATQRNREPAHRTFHAAAAATEPGEQLAAELATVAESLASLGSPQFALATMVHAASLSPTPSARAARLTVAAAIASSFGQVAAAHNLLQQAATLGGGAAPAENLLLGAGMKLRHDGDYIGAVRILEQALSSTVTDANANRGIRMAVHTAAALDDPASWSTVAGMARTAEPHLDSTTRLLLRMSVPGRHSALDRPAADIIRETHATEAPRWDPDDVVQFGHAAWRSDCLTEYRSLLLETAERTLTRGALVQNLELRLLVAVEAFQSGQWNTCVELSDAGHATAAQTDAGTLAHGFRHLRALVAAGRGDVRTSDRFSDAVEYWGNPRRSNHRTLATEARLLNHLSQGDSEGAWLCATRVLEDDVLPSWPLYASRMLLDVVEAHVRSGHAEDASRIAAHAADVVGSNHPLRLRFIVAAATALTANGQAGTRFEEALALDGIDAWPFESARVEYLYGQWLRRHFSNIEARRHLVRARDLFDMLGATPWSRRVANELRAAGVKEAAVTGNAAVENVAGELTPQESEVAALAAGGLSNKDIAARLFISPRTVSGHLYRIFPKLNVVSRAGLRDALATREAALGSGPNANRNAEAEWQARP